MAKNLQKQNDKKKKLSIFLYSQKVLFMVRGGCVENMLAEE